MIKTACRFSLVIPVYNSSATLTELVGRIHSVFSNITDDYEIIFVDDDSRDNSWEVINRLKKEYPRISPVQLTRNFGQHNAVMCGLSRAGGELVITLDDDLQHSPEDIPKLIREIKKGFDIVYGVYDAQHGWFRNMASRFLRRLLAYAIPELDFRYSSFRIMSQQVASQIDQFSSPFNFVDGYISWVTQKVSAVDVEFVKRPIGRSGYNLKKLISHTVNILTTFSTFPMRFAAGVGLLFSMAGMILGFAFVVIKLFGNIVPLGYTSIMAAILFSQGIVLLVLGVLGEYIAKMNFKTTNKVKYIVRE